MRQICKKCSLLLDLYFILLEFFRNSILFQQIKIPFGIKDLTSKICDSANIPEDVAINLLKIYRDVSKVDVNLPLINHFKQRFSDYTQTLICDINKFIKICSVNNQNVPYAITEHLKFSDFFAIFKIKYKRL